MRDPGCRDPSVVAELEAIAKEHGVLVSALCRPAITYGLEWEGRKGELSGAVQAGESRRD